MKMSKSFKRLSVLMIAALFVIAYCGNNNAGSNNASSNNAVEAATCCRGSYGFQSHCQD